MDYQACMQALQEFGTAQNRKIYARHGADPARVFGVSFANLNVLVKKIKRDHGLACQLWDTANYDARNLATKIADPAQMNLTSANHWVRTIDNYLHASLLGGMLAQSVHAEKLMQKWCAASKEFTRQCGYAMLGAVLRNDAASISDKTGLGYANTIAQEIHQSPNWARYSMNWALIALGIYKDAITHQVLETAKRIGKVDVDHGETSCKTPDAIAYIHKARNHPKRRVAHC